MRIFKAVVGLLVAAIAAQGVGASPAGAETATSYMEVRERGVLFREVLRPVDVRLEVMVVPDSGATRISQLSRVRLNLPRDLLFSPQGTPPCRMDIGQENPQNANRPTAAIIAECPDSVVGQGTAVINVAGSLSSFATITDPVLTVLNGGKDEAGDPILLVHGYSGSVLPGGYGVPMEGVLKKGVLDVKIPPLPVGSSVSAFTYDLPGEIGKDRGYARSKCSSGSWFGNAVLTLRDLNAGTGEYENSENLETEGTDQRCSGRVGNAKLRLPRVKGPQSVRVGKRGSYRVVVNNTGTATARSLKVTAAGRGAAGKGTAGSVAPGNSKIVRLKVKFRTKGMSKLKFTVGGKNGKSKSKTVKVKVK